jgi:hypothetical protein
MATKKTTQQFGAYVKVTFELFVPVAGATLEDALASARALKPTDCCDVPESVEHNHSEIQIEGVNVRY